MTTLTNLEKALLVKIARNLYTSANGAEPATNEDVGQVWTDCVVESAVDKGVLTSLKKKNIAAWSGNSGRDSTVYLTDEGFAEYKKLSAEHNLHLMSGFKAEAYVNNLA